MSTRIGMKNLIIKLSKNQTMLNIAKKIFGYFPSLKYMLIEYAYSYKDKKPRVKKVYKSDCLDAIKKEVEERKVQK